MAGIANDSNTKSSFQTQCYPLYSLLQALHNPTVNLFILDIEGAEFEVEFPPQFMQIQSLFQVLKTIPWSKVDIEVLVVEHIHMGKIFPGSREDVIDYLSDQNYQHLGSMNKDDYFVRRDLIGEKYSLNLEQIKTKFPFKLSPALVNP